MLLLDSKRSREDRSFENDDKYLSENYDSSEIETDSDSSFDDDDSLNYSGSQRESSTSL